MNYTSSSYLSFLKLSDFCELDLHRPPPTSSLFPSLSLHVGGIRAHQSRSSARRFAHTPSGVSADSPTVPLEITLQLNIARCDTAATRRLPTPSSLVHRPRLGRIRPPAATCTSARRPPRSALPSTRCPRRHEHMEWPRLEVIKEDETVPPSDEIDGDDVYLRLTKLLKASSTIYKSLALLTTAAVQGLPTPRRFETGLTRSPDALV
ncbi:hypothetical protein R3P38DRAFT_3231143 [Favolaschia claudopus]|uniref:Uncharacterized protein n=1 Tax=Favolaschia claudopus TaxID=2862362 RepID=A0AAV9ZKN4_9AGAR